MRDVSQAKDEVVTSIDSIIIHSLISSFPPSFPPSPSPLARYGGKDERACGDLVEEKLLREVVLAVREEWKEGGKEGGRAGWPLALRAVWEEEHEKEMERKRRGEEKEEEGVGVTGAGKQQQAEHLKRAGREEGKKGRRKRGKEGRQREKHTRGHIIPPSFRRRTEIPATSSSSSSSSSSTTTTTTTTTQRKYLTMSWLRRVGGRLPFSSGKKQQ